MLFYADNFIISFQKLGIFGKIIQAFLNSSHDTKRGSATAGREDFNLKKC